ncbi:unnamed protein product [Linum trigynum]|uniref:Uncharacterized protein n=1 Tax=Linum trigynum TaxID=586398 RepID=A0AAV2E057_9ROSI
MEPTVADGATRRKKEEIGDYEFFSLATLEPQLPLGRSATWAAHLDGPPGMTRMRKRAGLVLGLATSADRAARKRGAGRIGVGLWALKEVGRVCF